MTDVYGTHKNIVSEPSREDLTKIKGIGITTAEKLYNAKIVTVKQIAEMTPEKMSETPGIGLATATKFIAAAKNHLEGSRKEDILHETNQIQDLVKVESISEPIEKYEVQEVIVYETEEISEEPQTEVEEDIETLQTEKKWFPDKFNYSRLTTSYPPTSERAKNINKTIEEDEFIVVEPETKQFADNVKFDTQPEIEQVNEYDEEFTQEPIPEIELLRDQPELKITSEGQKVDYAPIEPKSIDFEYSSDVTFESIIHQQISNAFKDAGCYEIPSSLKSLKKFTTGLDYLGCKVVKASDDLRLLFLFPVKRFDQEGTVLVDEVKLELKSHSKKIDIGAYIDIEQISQNLLQVRDSMYEDITNDQNILEFFQKYLQMTLSLERGFGKKSLIFLSGSTQYKVFIEPILLCYNPPRSMEKSLAFPYQRSTNLHTVTRSDLAPLIAFLEKKYRMIEKRTKKTNTIKYYRQAEEKFHSNVKFASVPIFGYSVALLVVYFAELNFLLRLFNTIGFAVIGIYLSLIMFLYFRVHKTKKEFIIQFETPYYLQNLEFSETDLLDFRVELTDELLAQFGYECLGKKAKFGVIEQSETNTLKHSLEEKRIVPEFQNKVEFEQLKTENISNSTIKYGSKYSSFLDDL